MKDLIVKNKILKIFKGNKKKFFLNGFILNIIKKIFQKQRLLLSLQPLKKIIQN
jgi:hypothetical protein